MPCSVCGKDSSSKCARCAQPYCSSFCQTQDWPAHKQDCKAKQIERTLFRAAQLFRECYYLFRKKTFEFDVRSIKKEGQDLVVKTGTIAGDICGIFMRFPNELFENEEDKHAVLSMKMCTLAHGYFHDFITSTLRDSNLSLHDLMIRVKPSPSTTILASQVSDPLFMSTWRFMHTVLLVRSRRLAREWVIDITGSQFGIAQSAFSKEDYQKLYIDNIDVDEPFGRQNLIVKRTAQTDTQSGVRDLATLHAMESFMEGVKIWERQEGISLSKLLCVSDDEFHAPKTKLLQHTGKSVDMFLQTSNFLPLMLQALELERKEPGRGQRIQNEVNVEITFSNWKG